MRLFNFKKSPIENPKEVAWADTSLIYTSSDFRRYNPDDLIGRKGYGIYKRMMRDEQVKAVVKFKRDAISSRGFTFQVKEEISPEDAERRIALFQQIVSDLEGSFLDCINGILSAMYNGFSMSEIVSKQIEFEGRTWVGLKKLKLRPFDSFVFSSDVHGNIVSVSQELTGNKTDIDLDKFVYYVVNPDIDEHYGGSELREIYRAWFSKDVAIKFRNIWLERYAGGFRSIQAKEGKTLVNGSTEHTSLTNLLNSINLMSGIILPSGYDMQTEYPQGNGSEAFKKAIDDSDMQIARGLLVPPLLGVSPQGDTGSFAQSATQLETFFWTLEADSRRLEECLNEQLFRRLGEINFADGIFPRIEFKPLSKTKAIEVVRLYAELVRDNVLTVSSEDQDYIRDVLDLPVSPDEEVEDPEVDIQPEEDDINEPEEVQSNIEDEEDTISEKKKDDGEDYEKEESVRGRGLVKVSAFKKAKSRVAFAVIEKNSDSVAEESVNSISQITSAIAGDLIAKFKEAGGVEEDITDNIRALKVDSKLKQKLNSSVTRMLREHEAIGTRHARDEIDRASGASFTIDRDRHDFIAEDFFKMSAFKITGDLSDELRSIIEQRILSGARAGRSLDEIQDDIYSALATKGLLDEQTADEQTNGRIPHPNARVRTVVKTAGFDAINNARHSFFTDPALDNFVQAFEYSAILDSRTTAICNHLDGDNAGNHSVEWYEQNSGFRPPNHFNCRSLLIPVTTADMDTFTEGPQPEQFPQEGFG